MFKAILQIVVGVILLLLTIGALAVKGGSISVSGNLEANSGLAALVFFVLGAVFLWIGIEKLNAEKALKLN
jgi:hypothetical protein